MTQGGSPARDHGLEIRNSATSKCLLVHALTHPAEKNAQPTGMNLYETTAYRWVCSVARLQRWRTVGEGPQYLKIVGKVLYRLKDIEAYEEACLIRKMF